MTFHDLQLFIRDIVISVVLSCEETLQFNNLWCVYWKVEANDLANGISENAV